MNNTEYHQKIEQIWQQIEEQLEEQDCDVDCDTQGSVFTITFADRSQIVINKQEPLQELWLASKLGGYHFSYQQGQWLNAEGKNFWTYLTEACLAHGEQVNFI
ncbi:iron donor protein CyaY [Gallibacterium trehalosifermentans]|uniref:Iron-sulfur cluster assembly protein CyaY n=1 Tax=Gallibacterium trehalosifermentans TaxID=516935 RepID=A0ABV6H0X0_9PAST